MESDPAVTSTVCEGLLHPENKRNVPTDSHNTVRKSNIISDDGLTTQKAPWSALNDAETASSVGESSRRNSKYDDNMPVHSACSEFEIPEMEFDEFELELAAEKEFSSDEQLFESGRMTPDGLIDEDFERELGCAAKELSVQDVIDSDYPDISRLGVLQGAGDDKLGRKIIVFSACRLPAADLIDHQHLLMYITKTLEQYVSIDYVLIYFHFGLTNKNRPKFKWLVQAYRTFGRNFRKNLKTLYIVHPTTGIKILWTLFRPFIRNAAIALPILAFTSASDSPCPSMMLPRYVDDSTSSRVSPSGMIGLVFPVLYLRTSVFPLCMLGPTEAETAATLAVFNCICSCVWDRRARSSVKSKSSNWS
ncbi:unnamed protein product [Schistosoma curassoni]|nr:unnamed protein product [Schistosoma curassoni]